MNVVQCCGENCPDACKSLILWRPRRDLNPCYRRERARARLLADAGKYLSPASGKGLSCTMPLRRHCLPAHFGYLCQRREQGRRYTGTIRETLGVLRLIIRQAEARWSQNAVAGMWTDELADFEFASAPAAESCRILNSAGNRILKMASAGVA